MTRWFSRTRTRAADAGINGYVAGATLNDSQYYSQYLAPGEATRKTGTNPPVSSVLTPASPTPWPSAYGTTWTYQSKDAWLDLGNGYSYGAASITPPQTGTNTTNFAQITATGKSIAERRVGPQPAGRAEC